MPGKSFNVDKQQTLNRARHQRRADGPGPGTFLSVNVKNIEHKVSKRWKFQCGSIDPKWCFCGRILTSMKSLLL